MDDAFAEDAMRLLAPVYPRIVAGESGVTSSSPSAVHVVLAGAPDWGEEYPVTVRPPTGPGGARSGVGPSPR